MIKKRSRTAVAGSKLIVKTLFRLQHEEESSDFACGKFITISNLTKSYSPMSNSFIEKLGRIDVLVLFEGKIYGVNKCVDFQPVLYNSVSLETQVLNEMALFRVIDRLQIVYATILSGSSI